MARYTGPKTKISRKFGEPLFGEDRTLEKKNYPPGQHGVDKRRGKKVITQRLATFLGIKIGVHFLDKYILQE